MSIETSTIFKKRKSFIIKQKQPLRDMKIAVLNVKNIRKDI